MQASVAETESSETAVGERLYSAETIGRRLEKLRSKMADMGLDGLLITHPDNRRYLSGFTGHDAPPLDSAGYLVLSSHDACLITDGRYDIQAAGEIYTDLGFKIVVRQGRVGPAVAEQVIALGIKRLGFESAHLLHSLWRSIDKNLPDTDLVATLRLVEPIRNEKDQQEIELMRKAIAISDKAFNLVSRRISPGMTEKQVAWDIEKAMRDLGADDRAFETIVAAGPNGAMAHAVPGDRPINEGEPIVIDMGARLHGYNSDMTRTIILGEPTDKFREIYNIVLEAHLASERGLKSGIPGFDGDKFARDVIAAAGYGDKFTHSTGHGIGLEVHESISLSKLSEDTLPENGIVSVEPGIYLQDWGGVRIEDLVLLKPDGAEVLTQADKHPAY